MGRMRKSQWRNVAEEAETFADEPGEEPSMYRETWDDRDALGDDGLGMLLWGRDCSLLSSAHQHAEAIHAAGWVREDDDNDSSETLARVLYRRDLRHWREAEEAAGLIERLGWERYAPEPGAGVIGRGSAPLTEDEEAAVEWGVKRGAEPVALLNAILCARYEQEPLTDAGPEEGYPDTGQNTAPPFPFARLDPETVSHVIEHAGRVLSDAVRAAQPRR